MRQLGPSGSWFCAIFGRLIRLPQARIRADGSVHKKQFAGRLLSNTQCEPAALRAMWPCTVDQLPEGTRMIVLLLLLALAASGICAQEPATMGNPPSQSSGQQQGHPAQRSQGGMANAGPQEAEFDSQHRPITAGGFVKTGPIIFQDVAQAAGLTSWRHKAGTPEKRVIVEAKGPGVCLIDYDDDGWLDIYLVNGSTYDALDGKAIPPHAALFHNNHDGTFTDVTQKAGVANDRWGYGCAVGDYDNDGWPDLYVTNFGKNRLYRNNHNGTFTDVADTAGVAIGTWSTGATFGDYDGDGRLDLFVDGYAQIDLDESAAFRDKSGGLRFLPVSRCCGDVRAARSQRRARPSLPQQRRRNLYRREQEARASTIRTDTTGWARCLPTSTTTASPTCLLRTTPRRTISTSTRVTAHSRTRATKAAMRSMRMAARSPTWESPPATTKTTGISPSSILTLPTITTSFSRTTGRDSSPMSASRLGSHESSIPFVSFADGFLDYDNDGWKDLLIINGHVYPASGPASGVGTKLRPAPAALSQPGERQVRAGACRRRDRARRGHGRPRRGVWRHLQRRQDRRGDQQHGRGSHPAAQRESGPSSLGRAETRRRTQEPARCGRRDGLSDRERDAPARETF